MRIIIYLFSMLFMIIGFTFMLIYTNLFSFGYSFFDYIAFIVSRIEVLFFVVGFILLIIYKIKR